MLKIFSICEVVRLLANFQFVSNAMCPLRHRDLHSVYFFDDLEILQSIRLSRNLPKVASSRSEYIERPGCRIWTESQRFDRPACLHRSCSIVDGAHMTTLDGHREFGVEIDTALP